VKSIPSRILRQRGIRYALTLCGLVVTSSVAAAQSGAIYVDASAAPGGNGTSWASAYRFLTDALVAAAATPGNDEIRCAKGTQRPDQSDASPSGTGLVSASFQVPSGVTLVGGFAGLGAPDPDFRDIVGHPTVLSGELGKATTLTDNALTIVSLVGGAVTLDGVTITDGYGVNAGGLVANSTDLVARDVRFLDNGSIASQTNGRGGAVFLIGGQAQFLRCEFSGNEARVGGAIACLVGAVTCLDCVFLNNVGVSHPAAAGTGGAIALDRSSATIRDCRFEGNASSVAGAISATDGSTTTLLIEDSAFQMNSASNDQFGGGALRSDAADLIVRRCVFVDNSSGASGGAIALLAGGLRARIAESLFVSNHASVGGGAIQAISNANLSLRGSTLVDNTSGAGSTLAFGATRSSIIGCIIRGSANPISFIGLRKPFVAYSNVSGGFEGPHNSSDDPRFVDPLGGDYRLAPDSPLIDRGPFGTAATALGTLDLDGSNRMISCRLDVGCYESQHAGPDCNGNGIPDGCDERTRLLEDCDGDGLLDRCPGDVDCDGNGTADACETAVRVVHATGILPGPQVGSDAEDLLEGVRPAGGEVTVVRVGGVTGGILAPIELLLDGAPVSITWTPEEGDSELPGSLAVVTATIPASAFNAAASDGTVLVTLRALASAPNDPATDLYTHARFEYPPATSEDCNLNGIPDACDIAAPLSDCDGNGILDACEVSASFEASSPVFAPTTAGVLRTFTLPSVPANATPVIVTLVARGNFSACNEFIDVLVDGVVVGPVFTCGFLNCVTIESGIIVPQHLWPPAGTPVTIGLRPSNAVDPVCVASFMEARVHYMTVTAGDADADGLLDACCRPDIDRSGVVDASDIAMLLGSWGSAEPTFDLDANGVVNGADLAMLLAAWGPCVGRP